MKGKSKRNVLLKFALAFSLTGLLIYFLMWKFIDLSDIKSCINNLRWDIVALGGIFYLFNNTFRALRFMVLKPGGQIKLPWMFAVTSATSLLNQILPARIGEFSIAFFARRSKQMEISESIALLFFVRLADMITIAVLFFGALIVSPSLSVIIPKRYITIAGLILFFLLVVLFVLMIYSNYLLEKINDYIEIKAGINLYRPIKFFYKIVELFSLIRNNKIFIKILFLSFAAWTSMYFMQYVFLCAMNIHISYSDAVVGISFATLTNILPISGLGNLGTFEAGWTLGFAALGMDMKKIVTAGFVNHFLSFFMSLIAGVISIIAIELSIHMKK